MKYWRGYLVAAILGLISWALTEFAKAHAELIDMVYPYISRMIQDTLAAWSGSVDFLLWQFAAVVLVVLLLATIVLMIILRWNPVQWFGWVLAAASVVVLLHTGIYGLNYYAGPLADDLHLQMTDYTISELEEATIYYRDKANALSTQVERDANGDVIYPEFDQLAEMAGDGFHTMTYEEFQPIFAGSTEPVKELGWADMYTSMGITGYTMFITGEAAVNPQIPAVSLPFTMCHEMAHRMCIAVEQDANFAAFLACSANDSVEFQYSAYYMAYRYCYTSLSGVSSRASEINSGVTAELRHDLDSYNRFFSERKDETATKVADTVNDTYLKTSGDTAGVQSYGQVTDLLVSWHIQEIVLPQQAPDEVPVFDPLDKNQVDLTVYPTPEQVGTAPTGETAGQ